MLRRRMAIDPAGLFDLIRDGDPAAVLAAVEADPALLQARRAEDGVGPVLWALYLGRKELAATLAEAKGDLDLHEAAALGDEAAVRALVTLEPERVGEAAADGWTPLHLACFFGHIGCAELLLDAGADVNGITPNGRFTRPIHSAAAGRHLHVVGLLLDYGADPDAQQLGGYTAMHAAARHGDEALIDMLLNAAANAWIRAEDGKTAVEFAAEAGFRALAERLARGG